ncbi:MAG TPA: leucine-rich repeat domain-containing protein [Rhabdochlamydiaceae bacterium]|nr:leucine-rich repeat domain-containing protein [Rhabdochlamydiaceae bacterium]
MISLNQDVLGVIIGYVSTPYITAPVCKQWRDITELVYPTLLAGYQEEPDLNPFFLRAAEMQPKGTSEKSLVQTIYTLVIKEAGFFFEGKKKIKSGWTLGPNKFNEVRLAEIAKTIKQKKADDSITMFFSIADRCPDAQSFLHQLSFVQGIEFSAKISPWMKKEADVPNSALLAMPSLDLSHRSIVFLSPDIGMLKHLKKLCLAHNRLPELPKEIGNLTELTSLNLQDNLLEHLPEEIGKLTNLTLLGIPMNPLPDLDKEIFILEKLKKLQILFIDDKQSKKIPKELYNLKDLKIHISDGHDPLRLPFNPCSIM